MKTIKCPVCGETNPVSLDNCQSCNQRLRQSTSELDGGGKLINSGQNPTAKATSELESALPAWLKNARKGVKSGESKELSPRFSPPPVEEEPEIPAIIEEEKKEEDASIDWLAGLGLEDDNDEDDDEAADWLKNLQGDTSPDEESEEEILPPGIPAADEPITAGDTPLPSTEEAPIQTGILPNWMADLQEESIEQEAESLPDLIEEDKLDVGDIKTGQLPNWLSSAASSSPPAETPLGEPDSAIKLDADSPSVSASDPAPDWMAGSDDATPATDEDMPDWMSGLRSADAQEEAPEEPISASESSDDLPDWMAGSGDATPATDADMPDWMSGLRSADAQEEAPEEPVSAIESSDDLPDWMAGSDDATPATDEDMPNWMSGLRSADAQEEAPEEPVSASESSDDLPDWMAGSGDATPATGDATPATDADMPDWMSGLQSADAQEEVSEEPVSSIERSDDLPDWMANLQPDEKGTEETLFDTFAESEASADEDIPDWLSALPSDGLSTQNAAGDDAPRLGDVDEMASRSQASDPFADLTVDAEETEIPLAEKADIPDWLSQMETPLADDSAHLVDDSAEEEVDEISALPAEDMPAWLDNLSSVEGDEDIAPAPILDPTSADVVDEVFEADMPDWISSLGPEDIADDEFSDAEAPDEQGDASGAELPSWVQAMRPVADVVPDSSRPSDENVVGTGPLAGLSGVLPVTAVIGQMAKPQAHSIKLEVSESQQSSAAMLENLLAGETEPSAFLAPKKVSSMPILRWVITALLFLAVGSSLFSQSKITPLSDGKESEIQKSVDMINALPADGSVLLVFDYEAGFSGEMKAIALPLVTQLMTRGQNLVVISTQPTGPALAESLFTELEKHSDYEVVAGTNYQNLGYLAGGTSGIANFISSPHKTIGNNALWETHPLAEITKFSDFSAVVILTNDVEKGRNWIEQKTVYAGSSDEDMSPFLMAISAQAEPIIYPYYFSGQVDGLISGLSGSALYEHVLGEEGLGRRYWDAYSVGLLLAEILIAVGAMGSFLFALRVEQKRQKEEK